MSSELIEISEAQRRVLERCSPLGVEAVALKDALGRVLAEDVSSADDVPGFDNSAMDGFAVRAADTRGATSATPASLRIVDESRAGAPAASAVAAGEAIAISTGAMLPRGADAVVRVEDTAARDGRVEVAAEVEPGRDVRRAGDDVRAGEPVLAAGSILGPAEVGVLASIGHPTVRCARRPRVAVVTTGDELLDPSEPLRPGGVRNANAYSVPALAERAGAEVVAVEVAPDDRAATAAVLERALAADVAVVCGGVSVGEHDHVRAALAELGVEQVFWGVALRPGKPTWFGIHAGGPEGGALVFGLPGNPVSAMVTFILLARPAIAALLGAPLEAKRTTAILDQPYDKRPGRAHAVRCTLELRDDGWHASPTGEQGSHVLTSMLGAEALAILPTGSGPASAGDRVDIELLF
ncbi:MAG TPA: gephyrin-like molybdotransferase Glp [Solirubrobacterales bacterium]|nr:gephyrin-like molybdotransferase Glp [Solirubrobacterales bacterium]